MNNLFVTIPLMMLVSGISTGIVYAFGGGFWVSASVFVASAVLTWVGEQAVRHVWRLRKAADASALQWGSLSVFAKLLIVGVVVTIIALLLYW